MSEKTVIRNSCKVHLDAAIDDFMSSCGWAIIQASQQGTCDACGQPAKYRVLGNEKINGGTKS